MTSQRAFWPQAPRSEQGSLHWPRMHDLSMVQSESDWHTLSNYNWIDYQSCTIEITLIGKKKIKIGLTAWFWWTALVRITMRIGRRTIALSNTVFRSAFGIGSIRLELAPVNLGWRTSTSRSWVSSATSLTFAAESTDQIGTSSVGTARVGQTLINVRDTFFAWVTNKASRTRT